MQAISGTFVCALEPDESEHWHTFFNTTVPVVQISQKINDSAQVENVRSTKK